jgi:hypothetical protein
MDNEPKIIKFGPHLAKRRGETNDADFFNWLAEQSVDDHTACLAALGRWLGRLREIEVAAAELREDLFALVDEALAASSPPNN